MDTLGSLVTSHCADAVLSMANPTNVIGQIAGRVAEFVRRWIQSPTIDYDTIVAATFDAEWARMNSPVITTVRWVPDEHNPGESREVTRHTLYTAFQIGEPNGEVVKCHYGCDVPMKAKARKTVVRLTCTGCRSRCSVRLRKKKPYSALGTRGLVAVEFPRVQHEADWVRAADPAASQGNSASDGDVRDDMVDCPDVEMEDIDSADVDLFGEDLPSDDEASTYPSAAIPHRQPSKGHASPSPTESIISCSTSSSVGRVEKELSEVQPEASSSRIRRQHPKRDDEEEGPPAYLKEFVENPRKVVPVKRAKSAPVPLEGSPEAKIKKLVVRGGKKTRKQPKRKAPGKE